MEAWNCWIWEPWASEHHLELTLSTQSGITQPGITTCFCDFISHVERVIPHLHPIFSVQFKSFPKLGAALPVSQLGGWADTWCSTGLSIQDWRITSLRDVRIHFLICTCSPFLGPAPLEGPASFGYTCIYKDTLLPSISCDNNWNYFSRITLEGELDPSDK